MTRRIYMTNLYRHCPRIGCVCAKTNKIQRIICAFALLQLFCVTVLYYCIMQYTRYLWHICALLQKLRFSFADLPETAGLSTTGRGLMVTASSPPNGWWARRFWWVQSALQRPSVRLKQLLRCFCTQKAASWSDSRFVSEPMINLLFDEQ